MFNETVTRAALKMGTALWWIVRLNPNKKLIFCMKLPSLDPSQNCYLFPLVGHRCTMALRIFNPFSFLSKQSFD